MTKKSEFERRKRLAVETLQFLIRQRNIALFRLNAIRNEHRESGDKGPELAQAKEIVLNLRRRFVLEVDKNQHLLSDSEKQNYFRDNRKQVDDE